MDSDLLEVWIILLAFETLGSILLVLCSHVS